MLRCCPQTHTHKHTLCKHAQSKDLPSDCRTLLTQVLRFWMMHLTKLVGTYVLHAAQFWPKFTEIALCMYEFMARRWALDAI